MAIILNDNIKINAGKPSESKYLTSTNTAYASVSAANTAIGISARYLGLTVLIDTGTTNVEYWWREGVQDVNLIEKKFSSEQVIGDFVTGATNLGFNSDMKTGVQTLTTSGFPTSPVDFNDDYLSEYNWYYVEDGNNTVAIGSPEYDNVLRRAYVTADRTKSMIFDDYVGGWVVANVDVAANVGVDISSFEYTPAGSIYAQESWSGFTTNGTNSVNATGSLTTGTTNIIGTPIFKDKTNQKLNLRTIRNETPEFLGITFDDNYIRFSGVSSVLNGENIGAGSSIFTGKTDNVLGFRSLQSSGDTIISEAADGSLIIFSSSNGSTDTITGATNIGTGAGVYSGTTDRNFQLRTLVGSGGTIITEVGNEIIIQGGGSGTDVFDSDFIVSLEDGKTFGKFENGETVPASGLTAVEVILLASFEAKPPTVTVTSSANEISFGDSTKVVNLNLSYTINTLNATVASVLLEHSRGSGAWTTIPITTGTTNYTDNIDDSGDRFNTDTLNYRYTVTDSAGASTVRTYNISPQTYVAPTITLPLNGTVTSPETQNSREKGNTISNPSGTITSNRSLVNITDWTLERMIDGTTWDVLASGSNTDTTVTIPNTLDNVIPTNAVTIQYRITYVDDYTIGTSFTQTITFSYFSYIGLSTNTVLSGAQIQGLGNSVFAGSLNRTYNMTTGINDYAYYAYPSSLGLVSLITMIDNGVGSPTTIYTSASGGAFQILSDVIVTNSYGVSLNYKVYRSNAPGAFSTDVLTFS